MGKEIGEVDSIFLGSIGTIVETSEIQRRAFNLAFEKCKIPWVWEQQNYIEMLVEAGGKNRLKSYAEKCNVALDPSQIEKIYTSKNSFFLETIRSNHIAPRDGIIPLLRDCDKYEVKVGWITTANNQVVEALMEALKEHIDFSTFDLVTSLDSGTEPKPNPDIYRKSISQVGASINLTLAIEDSESGFIAAHEAGIRCLVVPGQYKKNQQFYGADGVLNSIEDISLSKLEDGRTLVTI
jgi:HAD superfamily hydrolase (TIGR01509 family)